MKRGPRSLTTFACGRGVREAPREAVGGGFCVNFNDNFLYFCTLTSEGKKRSKNDSQIKNKGVGMGGVVWEMRYRTKGRGLPLCW